MDDISIPTPPTEEMHLHAIHSPTLSKRDTSSVKSVKPANRISKRASMHTPSHDHGSLTQRHHLPADGRHKRVWKACERCRMKKTKCDGEFPCKRCKDDGLVCTAGTRKKTEYKQLPRGYAEVLENTQFALIATVHKLYAMVRNGQSWDLGEPELNDRGQPVIHNIAQKLGCIRPQNDVDLPVSHIFPEDESGLGELVTALEEHQRNTEASKASPLSVTSSPSPCSQPQSESRRIERAGSSESDHSDMEPDYRRIAFGQLNTPFSSQSGKGTPPLVPSSTVAPTLSPQSLNCEFDVSSVASDVDTASIAAPSLFQNASPIVGSFSHEAIWNSRPPSMEVTPEQIVQFQNGGHMIDVNEMLNQGLLESEFGRLKPHVMNCANPEVMLGVGDPMIIGGGFERETFRM